LVIRKLSLRWFGNVKREDGFDWRKPMVIDKVKLGFGVGRGLSPPKPSHIKQMDYW